MTKITLYIGILLLGISCSKQEPEPSTLLADVDDEFEIGLWEELEIDSRKFNVLLETIEEQECENQFVIATIEEQGNGFILNIEEITTPQREECIAKKTTAKGVTNFGEVGGGVYELQINLKKELVNKGKLLVSQEKYEVLMDSDFGFFLPRPVLHRIPEGTLWGYIAYDNQADEAIASEFVQRLSEFTVPANLKTGYYGHFELNDKFILRNEPEGANWASFLLRSKGQMISIRKTVNQYRNNYPNKLTIQMWTSEGEEI